MKGALSITTTRTCCPFYQIFGGISITPNLLRAFTQTNESPAGSDSKDSQINPELKPRNLHSRFTTNKNTHLFKYLMMFLNKENQKFSSPQDTCYKIALAVVLHPSVASTLRFRLFRPSPIFHKLSTFLYLQPSALPSLRVALSLLASIFFLSLPPFLSAQKPLAVAVKPYFCLQLNYTRACAHTQVQHQFIKHYG